MFGEYGSHIFLATHASIRASIRSSTPFEIPSPQMERPPTIVLISETIPSFGAMLKPRYIIRAVAFDQWAVTHSLKDGCF